MSAFAPSSSPSPSSQVQHAPLGTVASTGIASAAPSSPGGTATTVPATALPASPVILPQPSPQTTVFGSFLKITGLQPSAHYHVLANVSEKNFEKVMDRWEINGIAADMAQVGMATWAWHKSRQLCHLEPTPTAQTFTPAAAAQTGQSTVPRLSASGYGPNVPTIKVSAVLDQRISEESRIFRIRNCRR